MVAKIVQGRSFKGVVGYVLDKQGAQLIHADGVRMRDAQDKESIVRSFVTQSSLNPRISKPVAHISLDFSAQDRDKLTDEKMNGIAMEYLEKMGYGNTQFIAVRHNDTDHPHVHLVINRIDNDGKRISDQNEKLRSAKICKELTEKHGLYFATGKENVKEHRLREPDKTKYEIYNALKATVPGCRNWPQLLDALKQQGIEAEVKYNGSTSQAQGVSFSKNGYHFNGSKVDRQFSYLKIDSQLRQNNQAQDVNVPQAVAPLSPSPRPQTNAPEGLSPGQTITSTIGSAIDGGTSLLGGLLDIQPGNPDDLDHVPPKKKKKKKPQMKMSH